MNEIRGSRGYGGNDRCPYYTSPTPLLHVYRNWPYFAVYRKESSKIEIWRVQAYNMIGKLKKIVE
jgi:hypothetical protein